MSESDTPPSADAQPGINRKAPSRSVLSPSVDTAPARLSGMTIATTLARQDRAFSESRSARQQAAKEGGSGGGRLEPEVGDGEESTGMEMSDMALEQMICTYKASGEYIDTDKLNLNLKSFSNPGQVTRFD